MLRVAAHDAQSVRACVHGAGGVCMRRGKGSGRAKGEQTFCRPRQRCMS